MKKVLLITRPIAPPWDEASKNFAYFLAKTITEPEMHVLTPGHVPSLEPHIKQELVYSQTHLDWFQRLRLFTLGSKIKNFDIAHFMLTPNKLNSWAFKTFLTSPKTKTIQTVATLREDLFADQDFKKILFADLIITYSDYAKNKLQSLGFANVTRIYPGIDLAKYAPKAKDQTAMEKFQIKDSDFIIMYPGEYVRLGATDDLVATLPELLTKLPQAKFVFANRIKNEQDARKKTEVVTALEKSGILDRVIFTDTFADMPTLFNLADVVVFPVRNMQGKFDVPLAVIEAMACSKPVVISDLPILKEFATPDNSVIMETGNMQQFTQKICELAADENLRKTLGENARRYTQQYFDINAVAEQYVQTYNNLV